MLNLISFSFFKSKPSHIKAQLSYLSKLMRNKIVENRYNLEIVRNDPKSPLNSVKSFDQLRIPDLLLKGIVNIFSNLVCLHRILSSLFQIGRYLFNGISKTQ